VFLGLIFLDLSIINDNGGEGIGINPFLCCAGSILCILRIFFLAGERQTTREDDDDEERNACVFPT